MLLNLTERSICQACSVQVMNETVCVGGKLFLFSAKVKPHCQPVFSLVPGQLGPDWSTLLLAFRVFMHFSYGNVNNSMSTPTPKNIYDQLKKNVTLSSSSSASSHCKAFPLWLNVPWEIKRSLQIDQLMWPWIIKTVVKVGCSGTMILVKCRWSWNINSRLGDLLLYNGAQWHNPIQWPADSYLTDCLGNRGSFFIHSSIQSQIMIGVSLVAPCC